MAKRQAKKRRLTKEEIDKVKKWMESPGKKPTIKQIARAFGVNKPSVIKSLGGWNGIKRGRLKPPKTVLETDKVPPIKIEPFTTSIPEFNGKEKTI